MPLSIADLKPFFQVVIFRTPEGFDLANLKDPIRKHVRAKNKTSRNKFELKLEIELAVENPVAWHFRHTFPPSWYRYSRERRGAANLRNIENDLLLMYQAEAFLFVHASCDKLLERVSNAIQQFRVGESSIGLVDAKLVKRVLDNSDVRFSSVGIDNIFNAGGTAPEAKAYHGRSANLCVTPSFDAGFGVSYFLGRDLDNQSKPFGASVNKKKIWRTWVDDIDEFSAGCDQIVELMNQVAARNYLDVLAEPIDSFDLEPDHIVMFHMDYVSDKGNVQLRYNGVDAEDWSADLDAAASDVLNLTLLGPGMPADPVRVNFTYSNERKNWHFATEADENLSVVIESDEGNQFQPIPISQYFERRGGFSILLTEGRAYRNGAFWRDSRFDYKFRGADVSEIANWSEVDIKKEARPPNRHFGTMNILSRLEECLKASPYAYVIKDDNANEVADYVLVSENRFILAHAKASSERLPSLRVDDLHVVCSQALKNLRFFAPDSYTDHIWERLQQANRLTRGPGIGVETDQEFRERFSSCLRNRSIQKECWIVQPGISKAQLDAADTGNKIHCLLNFVSSTCTASNVQFKLICSA